MLRKFLALDLGYTEEDIRRGIAGPSKFWRFQVCDATSDITDKSTWSAPTIKLSAVSHLLSAWAKLRPKIEPHIEKAKILREGEELEPARRSRRHLLFGLYQDYLSELPPTERWSSPRFEFLLPISAVLDLVEADASVSITAQDLQPLVSKFPEYIADYRAERAQIAAVSVTPTHLRNGDPSPSASLTVEEVDRTLNLARNVFSCERCERCGGQKVISGKSMVTHHQCLDNTWGWNCGQIEIRPGIHVPNAQCRLVLHEVASGVSSRLIALAGLDPAVATIADLDKRATRFCVAREDLPHWWTTSYQVFSWRQAVGHSPVTEDVSR